MNIFRATVQRARAYWVYGAAALIVMLPLSMPGFILTLDMVFTPHLRMPETVTNTYVFEAVLYILSHIVPSDVIQKVMLLGILLACSIGMHRLIEAVGPRRHLSQWGVYAAGVFYAINPFTYSRFMAGQYEVLLGYALLPWFVRLLIVFGRHPDGRSALKLGLLTAVIGLVSIHTLGEVGIIAVIAGAIALWQRRGKAQLYARYLAIAGGVFLLISGYWLVPLLAGSGEMAGTISSFTRADNDVFAATGDSFIGRAGNILRLQGFWAEGRSLYLLPQDRMVLWGTLAAAVIALVILGGIQLWRQSRALTVMFASSSLTGLVLAAGAFSGLLSGVGYREPHKLAGLVALSYGVFLAFGCHAALKKLHKKSETGYTFGAVLVLTLPLMLTRVMLWGFDGQLTPRQYPASWAAVNAALNRDPDTFKTVFLPWHQYMSFRFAGRVIASPADEYFDKPMLISRDPELAGASGGSKDSEYLKVERIVQNPEISEDFGRQLAARGIKYVVLVRELDAERYAFVKNHPQFREKAAFPDIALYENKEWREK